MLFIEVMFPRCCIHCEREGVLLCAVCMVDLPFDGPPFAYANPVIRQLICAWKYDGDGEGLRILAALLRSRLAPLELDVRAQKIDAIVPMPLSSWKERWRGFHQAKDLARVIGEALKLPVVDVLERKHRWTAQANLSHDVRKTALKDNPFTQRVGAEVPKRILLIDDVITTGATMQAAEQALHNAGADHVVHWGLARG